MKPLYYLTSLLFLVSTVTFSQKAYLGGTYSIGIPLVGINNYITAGSYRGANFEGLKEINSMSISVHTTWSLYPT